MADCPKKRIVVILAGPPGSGKSTLRDAAIAYKNLNPDSFVDTDELTKRIFGIYNKENWKKAQALASALKQQKIEKGEPFAYETILGSIKGVDAIRDLIDKGYAVDVFYVTTESAEKCIERVNQRAKEGGHAQAPEDIRALYDLSVNNYIEAAKIADQTLFFDNTKDFDEPALLFTTVKGAIDYVNPDCPAWAAVYKNAIFEGPHTDKAGTEPSIGI